MLQQQAIVGLISGLRLLCTDESLSHVVAVVHVASVAGGTRTCIHTPGAALKPEELHSNLIDAALQDAALVYFDGRLTEAAIVLARAARAAGVPVLVEGERLRPGLQDLLAEADYVVTSAHFPQVGSFFFLATSQRPLLC